MHASKKRLTDAQETARQRRRGGIFDRGRLAPKYPTPRAIKVAHKMSTTGRGYLSDPLRATVRYQSMRAVAEEREREASR